MTDNPIKTISSHELKKRWDNNSSLCVIDVRELDEWQEVHIPGAHHIPKDEIASRIKDVAPDLDSPVYLHCKGGVRSLTAAQTLKDLGYTALYSLDGGIMDWMKAGYPVDR
ncbi:rhodanese-like domain-containing protein [Legionella taurinensis]|uniref:Rhodanese-like domain-containing protein n=1 Tax=Legionella taurinensis TaxID=70611 RepID=A0A3A5L7E5_9GAMM|nr:rhodanese-like domain-containing protein [Legionella taurinensis]MDX1836461.1 rhodanese-like domain-containing protein [Legionella taurinensis]PUT43067.1 sulfurtransferase [Legionella taurinensis]PUT45115.1 sulfurtransferase [Legionella taurinensis]PUT45622.1 sulfurtransferase [Legionella taurinensis]PUT49391.1 sulfurtransferase [Legionella taurinensis]